jgi:hypothetical protein
MAMVAEERAQDLRAGVTRRPPHDRGAAGRFAWVVASAMLGPVTAGVGSAKVFSRLKSRTEVARRPWE